MQQPNLDCERDEYPPAGFWQDKDIHGQWVRMVPRAQNGPAGAALFGLGVCGYKDDGTPPASTQNIRSEAEEERANRITTIYYADVTTTLARVEIRFDAYPDRLDFGLTDNPCWPSTLIDDPGFALLTSDVWYLGATNADRRQYTRQYRDVPPQALAMNNPSRQGYEKRSYGPVDLDLATEIKLRNCHSTDCVQELEEMRISLLDSAPSELQSLPRTSEAEPTVADTDLVPTATSTAAVVGGGGAQLALNLMPKPTGGTE